jgi:hypothetical protein
MKQDPAYEIRGRSLDVAMAYILIGILFIFTHYIVISFIGINNLELSQVLIFVFISYPIGLLMIILTYRTLLLKTVRIDGTYFYLYYGSKLKKKIALKDITNVTRSKIFLGPMLPFLLFYKFIGIHYREDGKIKSCIITEDIFPERILINIFEEFNRYAFDECIF